MNKAIDKLDETLTTGLRKGCVGLVVVCALPMVAFLLVVALFGVVLDMVGRAARAVQTGAAWLVWKVTK